MAGEAEHAGNEECEGVAVARVPPPRRGLSIPGASANGFNSGCFGGGYPSAQAAALHRTGPAVDLVRDGAMNTVGSGVAATTRQKNPCRMQVRSHSPVIQPEKTARGVDMPATVRTNSSPRAVVFSILAGLVTLPATTGVVLAQGSVVAWGQNLVGECNVPALPPGLSYVSVAATAAPSPHSVACRSDGSVVSWGNSSYGLSNVPALPPGLAYVEVAAGWTNTVARRGGGSV